MNCLRKYPEWRRKCWLELPNPENMRFSTYGEIRAGLIADKLLSIRYWKMHVDLMFEWELQKSVLQPNIRLISNSLVEKNAIISAESKTYTRNNFCRLMREFQSFFFKFQLLKVASYLRNIFWTFRSTTCCLGIDKKIINFNGIAFDWFD